MKLIKLCQHSTVSQDIFRKLAVLSVEIEAAFSIGFSCVIKDFVAK
jgi:hypothetical protein